MITQDKKVLLIYPASDSDLHYEGAEFDHDGYRCIPPGLLSIATSAEEAGYSPVIIDGRLYPKKDVDDRLILELKDAIAVGFSVMTCQVRHGVHLSKIIKSTSSIPNIWGGIHPSLFPEMTVNDDLVDYVVYGEGENSFVKLLDFISQNKKDSASLNTIRGLTWKRQGEVIKNSPEDMLDINKLPLPDYELLDIEKYIERRLTHGKRVRGIDIVTSRGCPYRCAFCTNTFLLDTKWRPLDLEKITKMIDTLVAKHRLNNIWFIDDFFFGFKERPLKIAEYLKARYGNISWEANVRADNFREGFVDDSYLKRLRDYGCHTLRMGAESGSNRVLKMIRKDINIEQIKKAVERCIYHDIYPILFFMIGMPGESKQEALDTLRFIFFLKGKFPRVRIFGPAIFRIYPGSELYNKVLDSGFKVPSTLREWGGDLLGGYLDTSKLPWLKGYNRFIEDVVFYINMFIAYKGQHPRPGLRRVFGFIASLRNRINFWRFRLDAKAVSCYKALKEKKRLNDRKAH